MARCSVATILTALLLCAPVTSVQAQTVPLAALSPDLPVAGTLALIRAEREGERVVLDLRIELPGLFDMLDARLAARGNLGDCGNRIYWAGPTRATGTRPGARVLAAARVRYELWLCSDFRGRQIRRRLLRDTRGFDLSITPRWAGGRGRLDLDIDVIDIDGVPDAVERLARGVLRVDAGGRTTAFRVPPALMAQVDPVLRGAAATPLEGGRGLALDLTLEIADDAMRPMLERLGLSGAALLGEALGFIPGWRRQVSGE